MIPSDEVESFVDDLIDEADQIEKQARMFFKTVSVSYKMGAGKDKYSWKDSGGSEDAKRIARQNHEAWQAKAEELVSEYRPNREKEFEDLHSTIQLNLSLGGGEVTDSKNKIKNDTLSALNRQVGIVRGAVGKVEVETLRARRQISTRVSRDEIERAWALFEEDYIRSAGVVAAVAVERQLLTMCEESDVVEEYDPTHGISRLAQTLKEASVIDKTTWNDMKALASIRETCAHAEEPETHRVRRLITDSESFIQDKSY